MGKELSTKMLSFSVHLLHISDVLVVLLAAAVFVCGHEEHREQVPKVEKVYSDWKLAGVLILELKRVC